jgi:cobalamin biosynthesis protein CobT
VRVDFNRMATKAIEAAIDEGRPRRRLSGLRAVVAGAALVGAARFAVERTRPGLLDLADLRDRVEDRLAESGWLGHEPVDEGEEYEDELVDEGEELEDDEDEELEGDEDEPVDEGEELEDDEDEPAADGDEAVDEEPDEPEDDAEEEPEDDEREVPGVEIGGNGRAEVDPAALPPEPPARRSRKKATSGSK